MTDEQQRRLVELAVAWNNADGRALDEKAEAALRRRFILARLEAALDQMHAFALDTEFVLVPGGYAGRSEEGYQQVSMGLKQAGHDYGSDNEQHLSFYLNAGRVRVERMIVTRHKGDNSNYVPSVVEADVSYDEATVSWFIDRMLDFMAEKVANPRPSGLPLQEPAKAPNGRAYYHRTGRILTLGWETKTN
ncbi:hypothetical protein V7S57_16770 [Caulobacter sp. CCNWLY153]|uniref:hypothetical protein n=1 Tax=unclassified Caulobacter TaxID=2648921 RepID=UPI002FF0EECA